MSSKKFPHLSSDVNFHPSVKFIGDVYVKEKCKLGEGVLIDASNGRIVIQENCIIGKGSKIVAQNNKIIIGKNSRIGENCQIFSNVAENSTISNNEIIKMENEVEN